MTQLLLPLSRPTPTPTGFWAELGEWMVGERDDRPRELEDFADGGYWHNDPPPLDDGDEPAPDILIEVATEVRAMALAHRARVNAQSGRRP